MPNPSVVVLRVDSKIHAQVALPESDDEAPGGRGDGRWGELRRSSISLGSADALARGVFSLGVIIESQTVSQ